MAQLCLVAMTKVIPITLQCHNPQARRLRGLFLSPISYMSPAFLYINHVVTLRSPFICTKYDLAQKYMHR